GSAAACNGDRLRRSGNLQRDVQVNGVAYVGSNATKLFGSKASGLDFNGVRAGWQAAEAAVALRISDSGANQPNIGIAQHHFCAGNHCVLRISDGDQDAGIGCGGLTPCKGTEGIRKNDRKQTAPELSEQ